MTTTEDPTTTPMIEIPNAQFQLDANPHLILPESQSGIGNITGATAGVFAPFNPDVMGNLAYFNRLATGDGGISPRSTVETLVQLTMSSLTSVPTGALNAAGTTLAFNGGNQIQPVGDTSIFTILPNGFVVNFAASYVVSVDIAWAGTGGTGRVVNMVATPGGVVHTWYLTPVTALGNVLVAMNCMGPAQTITFTATQDSGAAIPGPNLNLLCYLMQTSNPFLQGLRSIELMDAEKLLALE